MGKRRVAGEAVFVRTVATAVIVGTFSTVAHVPLANVDASALEADVEVAGTCGGETTDISPFLRTPPIRPISAPDPSATTLPRSPQEWREAIDRTWGEGSSTLRKLAAFDGFWQGIQAHDACFQGIDVDWQGLRDHYRPEIEAGVSRGRFAAIMNRLALSLMESHTYAADQTVNFGTYPGPGVPLMLVGDWGYNWHFGACLTPLPDGSALVYKVAPGHPLGLEPGDRVLGYEGRPWRALSTELLENGLPVTAWSWWGSTRASFDHAFQMSAGLNWHLFESIDVLKRASGETVHPPTAVIQRDYRNEVFCSEQMDVPGVPKPDMSRMNVVSWGVIEGTNIGYIYVQGWIWDAGEGFARAVRELTIDRETEGLIVDFRLNVGGNMSLSNAGLNLLFRDRTPTIAFATRNDPNDPFSMTPDPRGLYPYVIDPGPDGIDYDRPIAVLTGPGAVSSGDQVALRVTFHPRARTFGKPTAGAFNSPGSLSLGDPYSARYCLADAFRLTAPGDYLTHDDLPIDVPVWLEPDDVARGEDTVVKAAVRWIRNRAPQAQASAASESECASPEGAIVRLDGSASTDADSTPDSDDDIAGYDWFEDYGEASERRLGTGVVLDTQLPLGGHRITLRVTDRSGATDTVELAAAVVDTTPPEIEVRLSPAALWPPNHRLVPVHAEVVASDLCGSAVVVLDDIVIESSRGPGGAGTSSEDIVGASLTEPDYDFLLRATRSRSEDRAYRITYTTRDGAGNASSEEVRVRVTTR